MNTTLIENANTNANSSSSILPDVETRKKHTSTILKSVSNIIDPIFKDNTSKGYLIVFIHILVCFPTYLYLCFGSYNLIYYVSMFLWVLIYVLSYYFNGCILIRMERHFFNDKEWKGIWNPLFNALKPIDVEYSTAYMNNMFICVGVFLLLVVFLRFILSSQGQSIKI